MINPNNTTFIRELIANIRALEDADPAYNALLFDAYMELRKERDRKGDDYPYCASCRRPAYGVSRGCAECRGRHPEYYFKTYKGVEGAY